ncbi:MAG: SCP2 sterol-binding domain-containing protein [Solirubrobacteraceae bacterium]|nr:SCP2 sterol-binding domain-containing protein [Solirubrobacteraceae bacterium]
MSAGRAPDLAEALIGYRAWRIDAAGRLYPWTLAPAGPWVPGVNTAVCHMADFDPSRRLTPHKPPGRRCMCGIYALASPSDPRLHGRGGQVIGAIAVWGDVEVHRTGFRAEHAAVVALAEPGPEAGPAVRAAAREAAQHHGVALVPRAGLAAAAGEYGAPLDPEIVEAPDPREPRRRARRVGERGIALDHHVWVEPALGHVDVGLTGPFRRLIGEHPEITAPPAGMAVRPGDLLATVTSGDGATYVVWSGLSGTIAHVAAEVGEGRLVRVADGDWSRDQQRFAWGARAETHYRAQLTAAATAGRDVFGELLVERVLLSAPVRSGEDVLRELRRRRAAPAFPSAAALYAVCAEPLHERLARDPDAQARAARADATVRFETREPEGVLTLAAAGERVRLTCGASDAPADIVLRGAAVEVARFFAGTLDVARALQSRRLTSDAPLARTLQVLSVLKHVVAAPG